MIFVDATKAGSARHRSGLVRVTSRIAAELGGDGRAVDWTDARAQARPADWFFTAELFSERERPGFTAWLNAHTCRTAALFHDAIPLKLPHITWPQSVGRHAEYMKLLARFDRVFAVSHASQADLEGFWRWAGLVETPPVDVLPLGADFVDLPRQADEGALGGDGLHQTDRVPNASRPRLLCVGIVEPRKNQVFLLDVAERLWTAGHDFELHFVGRMNPHFGAPIVRRIKEAAKRHGGRVFWHDGVDDVRLRELYRGTRATAFPTIAEGCGLPLLESLWMGVPCVCSDLAVLRENAAAGGCVAAAVNDPAAWTTALAAVLTDSAHHRELCRAAQTRPLPTWRDTAATLRTALQ